MKANSTARYHGEVVYIYAFDVAYDTARKPISQLLGQTVEQFVVDASKRSPRQLFFYKPQMVRLPPMERVGPLGPVRVDRVIKLLPVGAISITVRVPFAINHVEGLVAFHDLQFSNGSLHDEVHRLAQEVIAELRGHLIRPQPQLPAEEAYTVFCIAAPVLNMRNDDPMNAEQWFQAHRRQIAALLTQEEEMDRLSKQEAEESTARYLSYYDNDLIVIDWDAALLVDEPRILTSRFISWNSRIFSSPNLKPTTACSTMRWNVPIATSVNARCARAATPCASCAKSASTWRASTMNCPTSTKFFGDWHLARIYEKISSRFHLGDWHRTIDGKLKTLDDLYQLLKHDQNNRVMFWLEVTIIVTCSSSTS
jgi:hypothetical protein